VIPPSFGLLRHVGTVFLLRITLGSILNTSLKSKHNESSISTSSLPAGQDFVPTLATIIVSALNCKIIVIQRTKLWVNAGHCHIFAP